MDDFHSFLIRHLYIPLAAVAGSISALASTKVQSMSRWDVAVTFFAGFFFAIFVTPWVAASWFNIEDDNVRAIAGLTYLFGAGSNILLPFMLDQLKRVIGSGKGMT